MNKSSEKDQIENKGVDNTEAFKIALNTRNFEIGLFWQRSNYFLVLNAGLAIGFFRIEDKGFSILFAIFGLFVSFLWYRVNLGSKYWQCRWENRLKTKEEEIDKELNFFAADTELIENDVEESLRHGHSQKSPFQIWVEKQVLKKPSVSYNMTLLSISFLGCWSLLILIRILK